MVVLVPQELAGRNVDAGSYLHANWIRWPASVGDGSNRLLSILSGHDFLLRATPALEPHGRRLRMVGAETIRRIGYPSARYRNLAGRSVIAVQPANRPLAVPVALLAAPLTGDVIPVVGIDGVLPLNAVLVHASNTWDDAALLARRTGGRVLVIEHPPADQAIARFWMFGRGWPAGVPSGSSDLPGLIDAREAGRLLAAPDSFRWRPNTTGSWGGPNRWLIHLAALSPPLLLSLAAFALYIIGCGIYCVAIEERGYVAASLLRLVLLLPAILLLGGALNFALGREEWQVAYLASAAIVLSGSLALGFLARLLVPAGHRLLPVAMAGLLAACWVDPLWSPYSHELLTRPWPFSGEAGGVLVAYLGGVCAFASGSRRGIALAALAAAGAMGAVSTLDFWREARLPLLPLLGASAAWGLGLRRTWPLVLLALSAPALPRLVESGVAWTPYGLLSQLEDAAAYSLWDNARAALSPSFVGLCILVAAMGTIMRPFFWRQIRRTVVEEPRLAAPLFVAAGLFASSLLNPALLAGAVLASVGACCAILHDAVRTL